MQVGVVRSNMVQIGATWCKLMKLDATLVQFGALGANWCKLVEICGE